MASLKDVAKLAGVSLMTVSRVLNDPQRVKYETLKRVQKAIEELNYVPDMYARQVRSVGSPNKTIGVLALDTGTTPFSVEITLSIEETARAYGWKSFVINMFNDDDSDAIVDLLLSHRPGGIIFTTMGLREIHIPKKLLTRPCVLANCHSLDESMPSYVPDDETGQFDAVKALFAAGYKKPLCLYLPKNHPATSRRVKGCLRACKESNIDPCTLDHYYMTSGDEHYRDFPEVLRSYIKDGKPTFDSVICGNDRIAFMVYQTLLSEGFKIPEDIGVLGYDNLIGIGDLFCPPISTVQLPHYEIGRLSTLHIINGDTHKDTIFVKSPFLKRESF